MEIKEIPLGRIGLDKETLVGLSVVAFSSLVGTSKDTVQNALIPIHQGKYAPQPLQHLLNRVFVDGVNPRDRFIRAEVIDDLLHYFGVSSNRFRKPAARDAIAKFADYGGFIPYAYHELDIESKRSKIVKVAKPKQQITFLPGAKVNLNIDFQQYKQDAEHSKTYPLPRRIIPIGSGIEVFGLPGFELRRGRYLLSETNAAEAVGKTNTSIIDFLHSNAFKALLGARPELSTFTVENAQKGIVGIPPELANIYWAYQLSKGNLQAFTLVSTFGVHSIEHFADLEFGIDRTKVEQIARVRELFWKFEAGKYAPHFRREYYDELYRVFGYNPKLKAGRPGIFSKITREYFYQLMPGGTHDVSDLCDFSSPGGINDLFGKINKSKDEYWHQFLTSYGDISFTFAMTSFLTFLRGLHPPCTFDKFVQYYNNTYSNGFQTQLNLFPESEAA